MKEFEANNTKVNYLLFQISMHFMNKKERNVTCIGTAELDLARLPNQPYSLIEFPLHNSMYPHSKTKIEIRREEPKRKISKNHRNLPDEMGTLKT